MSYLHQIYHDRANAMDNAQGLSNYHGNVKLTVFKERGFNGRERFHVISESCIEQASKSYPTLIEIDQFYAGLSSNAEGEAERAYFKSHPELNP